MLSANGTRASNPDVLPDATKTTEVLLVICRITITVPAHTVRPDATILVFEARARSEAPIRLARRDAAATVTIAIIVVVRCVIRVAIVWTRRAAVVCRAVLVIRTSIVTLGRMTCVEFALVL